MGVLVEGSTPEKAATKAQLDSWIASLQTPNTWTLDSEGRQEPLAAYFSLQRDEYILIDLRTMKVVEFIDGDPKLALQRLGALLAK